MKTVLRFGAVLLCAGLFSCGGGGNNTGNQDEGPVSNAGSTEEPAAPAADSSAASGFDMNAPSDSKGVGKFTSVQIPASIDAKMAAAGKEVFQTKCTACHQATEARLIGPGLKDITKIRTPEWIMNMMTNPVEMVQKDPVAQGLFEEFNHTQMTDQGVTDEEARQVLEFFRQNDAQ